MTDDEFDPDTASPAEFAHMYRRHGIQVVPAKMPGEALTWKRPALSNWKQYEAGFASQSDFDGWYGHNGAHLTRQNMGMVTGTGEVHRYFVVDLDYHKNARALEWFRNLLLIHNNNMDLETWTQRTGGGGLQLVFIAPAHWTPPTGKTAMGVDIRGTGGFAMLAGSIHESGNRYAWLLGQAPYEIACLEAPEWLCRAIDELLRIPATGTLPTVSTPSPERSIDPFGRIADGREDFMTRMIWAKVVDEYRECPIKPAQAEQDALMRQAYMDYENSVVSRIHDPGVPTGILLERENRGVSLFRSKWQHAFSQWDHKVRDHAAIPREPRPQPTQQVLRVDPETGEIVEDDEPYDDAYEALNVREIYNLPDPVWLVQGLVIEQSTGFIVGAPGSGKSFVALGLALSIATSRDIWFNRPIKRSGPIIYLSSEGVLDLKSRLKAWSIASQHNIEDAPFYLVHASINFMSASDVDRVLRTIASVERRCSAPPAMVFIDTVSRVLPGADENLQKDMTLFIGACDRIRTTFRTAVVGVHHTGRNGNMRGSTVFDGAADYIIQIDREEGAEIGYMSAKKIKAAADGWKEAFRLDQIILDPFGNSSLYAKPTDEIEQIDNVWPPKHVCKRILQAINDAWDNNKPWSVNYQSQKTGRYAIHNISKEFGVKAANVEVMLSEWQRNNVLTMGVKDKHNNIKGLHVTAWPY